MADQTARSAESVRDNDPLEPTHRSVPMEVMSATLDRLESLQAEKKQALEIAYWKQAENDRLRDLLQRIREHIPGDTWLADQIGAILDGANDV
jgi:hypothetical protein